MSQRDQDVYETPDPPIDTTNYDDDQKSIAVTRLDVSLQSSFDKFKDKSLDASSVDFSDSVNRQPQSGFKVQPDDLEVIVTEREPETILQRYQRLKQEVADLAFDVGRIEEGSKDAEKLLQVSPPDLLQDLQLLQKQLDGLQLDRVLGTPLSADQPHNTLLLRDLRAQIEAVKGTGEQGTDHALYEVYTRSEAAKFAHLSKMSEVEQRLAKLETLVGDQETSVSCVTGGLDGEHKDLSSAVMNLQAKVALLDPAHINTIGGQLQGLLSLLEQVETKATSKSSDPDKETKISEALDKVGVVSAVAPLIPDLVARLHTLKDLHERAAQFAGTVAFMADSQEKLANQISDLQSLLTKVQGTFQSNLSTIQSDFSGLESKLIT
ncbi:dynactin subunit 2-like isoform X2 [Halichondria panicea]|uniref:dynactin subunit 2-like isoform X2 n=1 Tax=Halichondria panicea TaxID=6063 RepID=UPI00312B83A8